MDRSVDDAPFAGLELGGTKCVCTLALSNEEVIEQRVVATASPGETLGAIEGVLGGWQERYGLRAFGIASFGPVGLDRASPSYGRITTTSKLAWRGTDVALRLERTLGVPTAFDTDVNGAALAEVRWGSGRGLEDFAYVTVGTGVGVGLVVGGRPTRGLGHPELGHIRIARRPGDDWPGACPYHGSCVEGLASGSAIAARLSGRDAAALGDDDPVWEGVAHALAQLCHVLACSTAPRRIAIGGGVVERRPHLLPRIRTLLLESLAGYVELPPPDGYVVRPALGDQAGPLGSIALAMDAARD